MEVEEPIVQLQFSVAYQISECLFEDFLLGR